MLEYLVCCVKLPFPVGGFLVLTRTSNEFSVYLVVLCSICDRRKTKIRPAHNTSVGCFSYQFCDSVMKITHGHLGGSTKVRLNTKGFTERAPERFQLAVRKNDIHAEAIRFLAPLNLSYLTVRQSANEILRQVFDKKCKVHE